MFISKYPLDEQLSQCQKSSLNNKKKSYETFFYRWPYKRETRGSSIKWFSLNLLQILLAKFEPKILKNRGSILTFKFANLLIN